MSGLRPGWSAWSAWWARSASSIPAAVPWLQPRGWGAVVTFLAMLVVVVAVVVLVVRGAAAASGPGGAAYRGRPSRAPRRPRATGRPIAPDDDPEFLRELERR